MNKSVKEFKKIKEIVQPSWAPFVKTGVSKQRPPQDSNWWYIRCESVLKKVNKLGPIGTNRLAKQYGGRKNRGNKPDKSFSGSRNIVRKVLQQLEKSKFIKKVESPKFGRVITKEGKEFLKKLEN